MNSKKKENEMEINFFPNDYRRHLPLLSADEFELVKELEEKTTKEIDYITFCEWIISIAKNDIGKHPNLEMLAAEIAYDNRKFYDLKFLGERSANPKLCYFLAMGYVEKNLIIKASDILKVSESHIEINNDTILHEYLLAKAIISKAKGDYLGSLFTIIAAKEYLKNSNFDELSFQTSLVRILAEESSVLLHLGRTTDAIVSIKEGLSLSYDLKNTFFTIIFELYYGNFLIEFERDFKSGSEYHKNAAKMAQKFRNPFLIALTLETIGVNLKKQRKLKEGLNFCEQAEVIFNEIGDERRQRIIANTIADLHLSFGNNSKALEILEKLEENDDSDLETIFNLINTHIRNDDLDKAELYLATAKDLLKGKGWVKGEFQLIFFEGLINLQSGVFDEAEKLLLLARDEAKENNLDYLALQASIQLLSVLVNKNLVFQSKRNFKKAKDTIDDLQHMRKIEVDSFDYDSIELMKAILLFSNKEYDQAKEIFDVLQNNFENFGEISRRKIVADYLEKINQITSSKNLLKDLKETTEINYSSSQILNPNMDDTSPVYLTKGDPNIFLIISDSGVPLYSYYFEHSFTMDQSLISGFITAIVHFTGELKSSKEGENLDDDKSELLAIRHGGFEILMEKKEKFVAAIIADKETYSLRRNLVTLTNRLDKYLKNFDFYYSNLSTKQSNYIKRKVEEMF